MTKPHARSTANDLRGASKLMIDAVTGVTGIVEEMHRNIARVSPIFGSVPPGGARGISGMVYRSVRGVTELVGGGLDLALSQLGPLMGANTMAQRETLLAALNGVLGDYMVVTANPLTITMQFRQAGEPLMLERDALRAAMPDANGRLLVLVHGLCMNDLQWLREDHDHGAALAKDLGFTPVYLNYNTGLPITANGAEFAARLEELVKAWPVPVKEITIIGHSMGGLVARSACEAGGHERHAWRRKLRNVVFLGSPLLGAPLERAGGWLDMLLGVSPYTAPFARLGNIRSAGVKDLRHGTVSTGEPHKTLARGVRWFALAASNQPAPDGPRQRLKSDGLVPVESALGHHKDAARRLSIAKSRQAVVFGIDHFDLLSSPAVYEKLHGWLKD